MKKLLLNLLILISTTTLIAQGSTCISSATVIDECGTAFTGTNPPDPTLCASHPCAQNDLDCDGNRDIDNSIENPMFWTFTPGTSCDYSIFIEACGCDGGSGPCSGGNFGWYQADDALPGGNITQTVMQNNFFGSNGNGPCAGNGATYCESLTSTGTFIAGDPVYIIFDGNAGSQCNFSITLTPDAACGGCVLVLGYSKFDLESRFVKSKEFINVTFYTTPDVNGKYVIEKSINGLDWSELSKLNLDEGNTNTQLHTLSDIDYSTGYNYYRLVDEGGKVIDETVTFVADINKPYKVYTITGQLLDEDKLDTYQGILYYIYEDGTTQKIIK